MSDLERKYGRQIEPKSKADFIYVECKLCGEHHKVVGWGLEGKQLSLQYLHTPTKLMTAVITFP